DIAHIKSGGKKQYVFRDEELKAGPLIPKNMEESENILVTSKKTVKIKGNEYTKWTEPRTKQAFYIDTRTGNSFFPCNDFAQSSFVEHRFNKKDFAQAQVIGQVDDKFIACKLPYSRVIESDIKNCTQQRILVLVDQHAADERVRVEMLMKEFCDFKNKERMQNENDNEIHPINSLVETIQINPPNKIILMEREVQVLKRFEANFNSWGIFFRDNIDTKQNNASLSFTTPLVSPHFITSSTDNDHIPIYVTHLPKMIADRCIFDSRVTQELLRQHLPSMIPIIYLDEFAKTTHSSCRYESQLKHRLYKTTKQQETTFDQPINLSWKRRKINLEQFRK
ncbi:11297_t:CDS:2, partial [Racocetra fulgida]